MTKAKKQSLSDYMPSVDVQNMNIAARLRAHCPHRLSFAVLEAGQKFLITHWPDPAFGGPAQTMMLAADEVIARTWEPAARDWLDYLHEEA